MKTIVKFSGIAIIVASILFTISVVCKCISGNYWINSPFNFVIVLVLAILAVSMAVKAIKFIWTLPIALIFLTLQGCNYAKSNQQVVVSDDCGMTWKKINAGEAVPKGGLNMCYMKVVIPNYPMQGDAIFISNLKDKVRANVHIDYDYSITEPLSFIKQAKYLGKANVSADDSEAINDKAFQMAENMVIDKRIKDVAKDIFVSEDIVELDQSEIENKLLIESNKVLEQLGVHLNFITLTFDLDEQTRQAIDVSTAMKIYESKGIIDVGKQVMSQRAGATKITVENQQPSAPQE